MSKTICIYHGSCADGFTSAWVVKQWADTYRRDVEFFAGVHGDPPPDVRGKDVIICDFSYKRPVMEKLIKECNSVVILDHHKSAIEDLAGIEESRTGRDLKPVVVFDTNRSGAMITWNYFFPNEEAPKLVQHVQDRDLWKFELTGTREIQAVIFSYDYTFENWDMLDEKCEDCCGWLELCDQGTAIMRKMDKDIREMIDNGATEAEFFGHKALALNVPYIYASDAGDILAQKYGLGITFWNRLKDGKRVFSLRSTKDGPDVSLLAAAKGGGGHKHAAGFTTSMNDPITVIEHV